MPTIDVSQVLATGDPIPAAVDVAMVGVRGMPWAPPPAVPVRVDVAAVAVSGAAWESPPAHVEVATVSLLGTLWSPAPDPVDDVTLWRIDADGVWRPTELVPL